MANSAIFLLGLFTLSKNIKSATNLLFSILCVALIGWTTANYFSLHLTDANSIFLSIKFIFAFVVLQNTAFFLFVNIFPSPVYTLNKSKSGLYALLSAVLLTLALLGAFFKGYTYELEEFALLPSPLIALFISHSSLSIYFFI